jgi:hypothetical protein
MIDDELRRSADKLRYTADKLRKLARQTRSMHVRDDLLDLAERCERMARCVDNASPGD